jgi:hypothetical protein
MDISFFPEGLLSDVPFPKKCDKSN